MGRDPKVGRGFLWRGSLEQTWVEWVAGFVVDRGPSERILTKRTSFQCNQLLTKSRNF